MKAWSLNAFTNKYCFEWENEAGDVLYQIVFVKHLHLKRQNNIKWPLHKWKIKYHRLSINKLKLKIDFLCIHRYLPWSPLISQAHGCVGLYTGRNTASSVTESCLESMRINVLAGSEEGGAAEKPGGPLSQNARPKPTKHNRQQQQCSVSRLSNTVNVSFRFQENLTRWKYCNKFTPHATSTHAPVVNGVFRGDWNWYMFMIRTRGRQSLTISIWTVVIYPEKSPGCNPDLLLKKHWIAVTLDGRVEPRESAFNAT